MTAQEFKNRIEKAYSESHNLHCGDGGFDIRRGMGHTMSGYVEDLFALYMAEKLNNHNLKFWVDKVTSIRFRKQDKALSFKPDLMIIKDTVLTHYFDLKTNLGWNRNLEKYLIDRDKFIGKIKGRKPWCKIDKQDCHLSISDKLKYQIVLVFDFNINKDLLSQHIEFVKGLQNLELYILIIKKDGKDIVNTEDFERLDRDSFIQLAV